MSWGGDSMVGFSCNQRVVVILGAERDGEGSNFGVDGGSGHGGDASNDTNVGCCCEKSGGHDDGWYKI